MDFILLEQMAKVVFTDSGGAQEETTMMGIKAREKVLNCYNWDRAARDTYELFRSLI
jgi:UDP-N-acetylglucosamine 2-epimerase